jgi:hypothetical protein
MEHQTHFDVNAAIENWRNELSAQTALSADDRRELETHLRDSFAELKSRGLNEEESFVLARHRVGQPQKLADEFVKENPAKIWRERIFWMWAAIFLMGIWQELIGSLTAFLLPINGGSLPDKIMLPELLSLSSFWPLLYLFFWPSSQLSAFQQIFLTPGS